MTENRRMINLMIDHGFNDYLDDFDLAAKFSAVPNHVHLDFLYVLLLAIRSKNENIVKSSIVIMEEMIQYSEFQYFLQTDIFWEIFSIQNPRRNIFTKNKISRELKLELDTFLLYWKEINGT